MPGVLRFGSSPRCYTAQQRILQGARIVRVVVGYDISSNASRKQVADILLEVLTRVQYSVFEGEGPAEVIDDCVARALPFLDPASDSLRVYRLCAACTANADVYGQAVMPDTDPVRIL